jgi:Ser/Thr protein kinase RdoA (MazF antagonist)
MDSFREYIGARVQRLEACPGARFTSSDAERILSTVDRLGTLIPAEDLREVAIHADLSLGNVLVSQTRIVVLDFAMAKRGTALHDLTRLFLQIDLLAVKPQMSRRIINEVQRALLAGFDPLLTPNRPLFRLLMLLHRVNHLASLSVNRVAGPEAFYNSIVRYQHRRWIAAEITRSQSAADRT